jgi:hypothetical protein
MVTPFFNVIFILLVPSFVSSSFSDARQVVFINTSPPDKRTFLLKKTSELEKMSKDSTDIESNNEIKRYSKRPKALENLCLADYISQLQVNFK